MFCSNRVFSAVSGRDTPILPLFDEKTIHNFHDITNGFLNSLIYNPIRNANYDSRANFYWTSEKRAEAANNFNENDIN